MIDRSGLVTVKNLKRKMSRISKVRCFTIFKKIRRRMVIRGQNHVFKGDKQEQLSPEEQSPELNQKLWRERNRPTYKKSLITQSKSNTSDTKPFIKKLEGLILSLKTSRDT